MDLNYLIDYCEEHRVITLVEADELRNDIDVLESKAKDNENDTLRIEQLEDKLIETTDTIFRLRRENETYKKKLKHWKELLKVDGCNTKHQVLVDIMKVLKDYE